MNVCLACCKILLFIGTRSAHDSFNFLERYIHWVNVRTRYHTLGHEKQLNIHNTFPVQRARWHIAGDHNFEWYIDKYIHTLHDARRHGKMSVIVVWLHKSGVMMVILYAGQYDNISIPL